MTKILERLRQPIFRLGLVLVVMGGYQISSSLYFRHQDQAQRHEDQVQRTCIVTNFSDLATALIARGKYARKDTKVSDIERDATRLESKANNEFYKAAFSATDTAGFFDAYGDYRVKLHEVNRKRDQVDRRRTKIADDRAAHPIPSFPEGTCE